MQVSEMEKSGRTLPFIWSFEDYSYNADDSVWSGLILWSTVPSKNIHETLIWLSNCISDRGGSDSSLWRNNGGRCDIKTFGELK